jgi:hypothetical protein
MKPALQRIYPIKKRVTGEKSIAEFPACNHERVRRGAAHAVLKCSSSTTAALCVSACGRQSRCWCSWLCTFDPIEPISAKQNEVDEDRQGEKEDR